MKYTIHSHVIVYSQCHIISSASNELSKVKMEEGQMEEEIDIIHPHCSTCIKVSKCNIRQVPGNSCEIIYCDSDCGARFHACKNREHKLLCANEKVPCINAVNGCPILLPRRDTGRHLATCPASVVHCTMEWNRWPVCSRERQMHIPFHQPNPNARAGQLDVALALRDQRMLNQWLRAPRKTRRALRNSLTRRFPAVPLQLRGCGGGNSNANVVDVNGTYSSSENSSSYPSRTITDDEEDTPWEIRKTPPGLQRSVCGELYKASKQTTESLTAALTMITNARPVTSISGDSQDRNIRSWRNYVEDKENRSVLANNGYSDEYGNNVKNSFEEMDVGVISKLEEDDYGMDDPVNMIDDLEFESPGGYDILFVDHTVVSEISSASMTDHARKQPLAANPPPPPSSPPLFVNLGLDLTLESITRYQTKPKSMYTFLCAQEFRRDEYSWHYKNIHSDIHGGLNGWLEQRCPLAHYGCMFSFRRFFPTCCGSKIVHNDILESFGVQPYLPNAVAPAVSPRSSVERLRHRSPPKWTIDSLVRWMSFRKINTRLTEKITLDTVLFCQIFRLKFCNM
ncbi:hypothetical protein CHUAL_012959 [Chamberlinius hualienensis]